MSKPQFLAGVALLAWVIVLWLVVPIRSFEITAGRDVSIGSIVQR